ncbi:MAG: ribosomal protein [Myxococcales bacterium]|nr:ribosomal protein [Myxococcales bacterium]
MAFRTGLLGKKIGITSIFTPTGDRTSVTAIHAGPCVVIDKMTPDKHGYSAVKLGFGEKPLRRTSKPELGVFTKANVPPQRFVREVRLETGDLDKFEVGQTVPLTTVFAPMSYVDVEGVSKGKGFQGVMKRHHMPGFRATHGTHEFFRHGGSIGCRLTPGKVHKGKRMGGHMGDDKKTIQNLVLLEIDEAQNLLLIQGSVPGGRNGFVVVRNAKKKTGVKVKLKGQGEPEVKSKNPMKASKAGGTTKAAAAKPAKK